MPLPTAGRTASTFGWTGLWAWATACSRPRRSRVYERQPLTDESGNLSMTMDGRVDNREELISALKSKGARLRDDTDAELVLQAYEYWGY